MVQIFKDFDTMDANTRVISLLTILFLVSLSGAAYAELAEMNGTTNLSQPGNISVNLTNQSTGDQNTSISNTTPVIPRDAGSFGGIRNFMKSYRFQSAV